jgi:hypothetical protein
MRKLTFGSAMENYRRESASAVPLSMLTFTARQRIGENLRANRDLGSFGDTKKHLAAGQNII